MAVGNIPIGIVATTAFFIVETTETVPEN
jgi:hypothetical protein